MAGHSKWAQIKRKKAVTDARRGQLFTKLLKEITVAARIGGGDQSGNARLRTAIQEAKSANVPNDNIDRAVKRGTGELEGVAYQEISYEGYGAGGAAIFIEAMTDNRNRTVAEVRHQFSKFGGSMGDSGCVAWMFDKKGYFAFDKDSLSEEEFMDLALELEVDDLSSDEDAHELFTAPERYAQIREALSAKGHEPMASALAMLPHNQVELTPDQLESVLKLVDGLEELDDVQNVWTNVNIDAAVAASH